MASETVQNLAESLESTFGTEQRILDDLLDAELSECIAGTRERSH